MRGRDPGDDTRLPIQLGPMSKGEYWPVPSSARLEHARKEALRQADANAQALGIDRRTFLQSASGAATVLLCPPSIDKFSVARTLRDIATLLQLSGQADRFRTRAYRIAAASLESLPDDLGAWVDEGRLTEIEGVGEKLARQIAEIWQTGRSSLAERLASELPPGSIELAHVPGLTIKRVRALHAALGTASLADVQRACEQGRVRQVRGFGPKTEARILEGVHTFATRRTHVRLAEALRIGAEICAYLRSHPSIRGAEQAGEARRAREVVDELVVVVDTSDALAARQHFGRFPSFALRSDDLSSARLATGLSVRLVTGKRAAWQMLVATGPAEHVTQLSTLADPEALAAGRNEAEIYEIAQLPFIPPELRDAPDALARARAGETFDDVVSESDLRGFVHCHTHYSDGRDSILDMALAAERLGASYITITDHSQSAHYAGGLTSDDLARQWDEIASVQETVKIRLLRGIESDTLADGALDYPDSVLEKFDVIIASLHGQLRMNESDMTRRLEHMAKIPLFKIWGHPLGRLLLRRPPVSCDLDRVLDAIGASPAAIEVNGDPHRLDLPPDWIRMARQRGIPFVLSTDAHSTRSLSYSRFSVLMARRGGLRVSEVLNSLDADEFARRVRPLGPGAARKEG